MFIVTDNAVPVSAVSGLNDTVRKVCEHKPSGNLEVLQNPVRVIDKPEKKICVQTAVRLESIIPDAVINSRIIELVIRMQHQSNPEKSKQHDKQYPEICNEVFARLIDGYDECRYKTQQDTDRLRGSARTENHAEKGLRKRTGKVQNQC